MYFAELLNLCTYQIPLTYRHPTFHHLVLDGDILVIWPLHDVRLTRTHLLMQLCFISAKETYITSLCLWSVPTPNFLMVLTLSRGNNVKGRCSSCSLVAELLTGNPGAPNSSNAYNLYVVLKRSPLSGIAWIFSFLKWMEIFSWSITHSVSFFFSFFVEGGRLLETPSWKVNLLPPTLSDIEVL